MTLIFTPARSMLFFFLNYRSAGMPTDRKSDTINVAQTYFVGKSFALYAWIHSMTKRIYFS